VQPTKILGAVCAGGGLWAILFQLIPLGVVLALVGSMLLWGDTQEEV